MANRSWPWVAIVALGGAVAWLVGFEWREHARLAAEIARQQLVAQERTALRAENRRLVAAQLPAEELDRLRAERAAVAGLRTELEAVKRRTEETARRAAPPETKPREKTLIDGPMAAGEWRNAGAATPEAAFESVLWAAEHGEIGALADRLSFDAGAREKAAEIFARLPGAMQQELGTPEQMIALLTAKDVPLGSAQITGKFPARGGTLLVTQLTDASGKAKSPGFRLRNENGQWQLVVSSDIVQRYAVFLGAPAGGAPAGK